MHPKPMARQPWIVPSLASARAKYLQRLHRPKPSHGSTDGLDLGRQVDHPITMIVARGSVGQRTSHAARFGLNIHIWLYMYHTANAPKGK